MEHDTDNMKGEMVELHEIKPKNEFKEIPSSPNDDKRCITQHIPTSKQPPIEGRSSLFRILLFPVLNAVATIIFIAITIMAFHQADGMPVQSSIAGMSYPSFIGLMMTLILLLLSDGIGHALSEYKWVRFERRSAPLSLLEAYDACSAGLGGVLRSVYSIQPDTVLAIALLFHFGILATAPLAQQLLTQNENDNFVNCIQQDPPITGLITNISRDDFTTFNPSTGDPRSIKLYAEHSTILKAFKTAFTGYKVHYEANNNTLGWNPSLKLPCPGEANSCNYTGTVSLPYLKPVCTAGTYNTSLVDTIFDNTTNVARLFFERNTLEPTGWRYIGDYNNYQSFWYHGSMENHTYYSLGNLTLPSQPSSSSVPVPPNGLVVQPRFVALMKNDSFNDGSSWYENDLIYSMRVHDCTFQPMINVTEYVVRNSSLIRRQVVSSTPVPMDYAALNDPSYWQQYGQDNRDYTMANFYAMQLSVLKAMIIDTMYILKTYSADTFFYQFDTFMYKMADSIAEQLALTPPPGHQGDLIQVDTVCLPSYMRFQPDPASYIPMMLCLVIPLIWWVALWLWSLKQAGWISRGDSQIALVLHDLTASARRRLGNLSHMDQFSMMVAARNVRVKLGEPRSDDISKDPLVFGQRNEVDPRSRILQRRKSV